MYGKTLFFSSYETILSIIFGLLTIFIVYKILDKTFLRKFSTDEALKKGNVAIAIFCGSIVICVLILVETSILPSIDAMRTMVLAQAQITWKIVCLSFLYFILFYAIALIISLIIIMLAIWIYMRATTKIEEIKEIKENNIAVAVIISIIILGATLFIKSPVKRFISSLIDYDAIEKSYVQQRTGTQEQTPEPVLPVPQGQIQPRGESR